MLVFTRKAMGLCLAAGLTAFVCYRLVPAAYHAATATAAAATTATADAKNPLMQDDVYAYAHALSTHFRKDPACDRQAAMLLNFASPLAGSEEYRRRVVNELLGKIPDHCIGR